MPSPGITVIVDSVEAVGQLECSARGDVKQETGRTGAGLADREHAISRRGRKSDIDLMSNAVKQIGRQLRCPTGIGRR